jgi:hypothetical protein
VKTEAKVRVILPQAKECMGLPKTERDQERSYSRTFAGILALPTC